MAFPIIFAINRIAEQEFKLSVISNNPYQNYKEEKQ